MAEDQHYLVTDNPGNAAYQVAPRKRVIIAGAIRETLAGAPLTLARAPSAASLKKAGVTVHIDQAEVHAVVRDMVNGDPIIAPPAPARLEVSKADREAITSAIRRIGIERVEPKAYEVNPFVLRNVDQGQINVADAQAPPFDDAIPF